MKLLVISHKSTIQDKRNNYESKRKAAFRLEVKETIRHNLASQAS